MNMKLTPAQQLKWELARERFHLEEPCPPPELRPEKPINAILAGILDQNESDAPVLPEKIADLWPTIAGEQLKKHTRPSHLKNGILYVNADHPGWLAELRRVPRAHLLKKISLISQLPEIKDIRFQLEPDILTFRRPKKMN
jgi:predicted nucleic acid-binding Zn ribbon protein